MTRISTLAALTWSTLSFAQQAHLVCEAPRVWVEGALPTDWSGAVSKVCSELGHLNDLDPAAQAKLTTVAPRVKVSVRLNDGRTAERRLTNPARLLPTLEALMVLPRLPRRTDGDDATSPATQSSPPLPETVGSSALASGGAVPNPSPDPVTETSPTAGADAESPVRHPLRPRRRPGPAAVWRVPFGRLASRRRHSLGTPVVGNREWASRRSTRGRPVVAVGRR